MFCLVIAGTAQSSLADDLYPPAWRGFDKSTMQVWEFGTQPLLGEVSFAPDASDNEFGTAMATLYGDFEEPNLDTRWINEVIGHQGVWHVGDVMGLYIPNDATDQLYKYIRLQLTYNGDHPLEGISSDPWIDVTSSAGSVDASISQIQTEPISGFTHAVYDIVLQPSRSDETIWIRPGYDHIYVDEVVVDTLASDSNPAPDVPEPSALVLLAMSLSGLVIYGWKRRRNG